MTLSGIVFDFDGVIANSEPLHFQGFREVLADEGLALTESDYYARYLGFDDAGAFEAIGADRGVRWPQGHIGRLVERKAVRLEALEREQSVLFPGAAAAIERLASTGPLAIASGALKAEITRILVSENLARHFTVVVGAEDTPASKPDPIHICGRWRCSMQQRTADRIPRTMWRLKIRSGASSRPAPRACGPWR